MNYTESFEDDGFLYTLRVQPTDKNDEKIFINSQGDGYLCEWEIRSKKSSIKHHVSVTNDDCDALVYPTVEAARIAAKHFISAAIPLT